MVDHTDGIGYGYALRNLSFVSLTVTSARASENEAPLGRCDEKTVSLHTPEEPRMRRATE